MEEGLNAKGVKGDIGVEIWPGGGEGWREGWVGGGGALITHYFTPVAFSTPTHISSKRISWYIENPGRVP